MIRRRYKTIVFILLTFVLLGSILFYLQFRGTSHAASEQVKKDLYELLPPTTTAFFDLTSIHQFEPCYNLFYGEDPDMLSSIFRQVEEDRDLDVPCVLSTSDLGSLENSLVILPHTESSNLLLRSILREYACNMPSKKFLYRQYELVIHSLKDGRFLVCGVVDGALLLSYQKYKIEEVIDAFLDNTSLNVPSLHSLSNKDLNFAEDGMFCVATDVFLMGRNALKDTTLVSEQDWLMFSVSVESTDLIAEAILKRPLLESTAEYILDEFPADAFAYYHWAGAQVDEAYDVSQQDTLLTSKEGVCNDIFYTYLTSMMEQGIANIRILDSVISSDVMLSLSLSNPQQSYDNLKMIIEQNAWIIRSLLRDEGIYQYNRIIPFPAPLFLNLLTGMSRDKRVIYIQFYEDQLLMAWNEDLLKRYSYQLQGNKPSRSHITSEDVQRAFYPCFMTDLGALAQDTLTNYSELPAFILDKAHKMKGYILSYSLAAEDTHTLLTVRINKRIK